LASVVTGFQVFEQIWSFAHFLWDSCLPEWTFSLRILIVLSRKRFHEIICHTVVRKQFLSFVGS
jgi:hypothetical protein